MPTDPAGAREEVLRRIRTALGGSGAAKQVIESEWDAIQRDYRRKGALILPAVIEELQDRLRDYDAHVAHARMVDVSECVAGLLRSRGVRRLVIPAGLNESLGLALPEGFEYVEDHGLSAGELDGFEGVITGCTVAISQTGTLVLQKVPGQGRRAPTLVPDYHLCIVRESDVVETVPEAFERLRATATLPTTFVSGPSATADIEMTRIKGVHGPRFLDVVLISGD